MNSEYGMMNESLSLIHYSLPSALHFFARFVVYFSRMMRPHQIIHPRLTLQFVRLAALACVICLGGETRGQDQVLPPQPAPPPMKYIPTAERAQLSAETDIRKRTRLSLTLAEDHLLRAEQQTERQHFDPATAELGIYQALIRDAISFLKQAKRDDGKMRDQFKRIELTLYKHASRIEAMRRTTPPEYAGNLRAAIKFAQEARSDALNAFYGNTVLRDEPINKTSFSTEPPQEQPKPPPATPNNSPDRPQLNE